MERADPTHGRWIRAKTHEPVALAMSLQVTLQQPIDAEGTAFIAPNHTNAPRLGSTLQMCTAAMSRLMPSSGTCTRHLGKMASTTGSQNDTPHWTEHPLDELLHPGDLQYHAGHLVSPVPYA